MKHFCLFSFLLVFSTLKITAQTYCPVTFPGGVAPITEVQFGTMTHTSTAVSAAGHEDFTMTADTAYGITELVVKGHTGGNFTDSVWAYFDWNSDGDFTDAGEEFVAGTITNSTGNIIEAAVTLITIPAQTTGNVRMRIVKKRGAAGTPCNSTGIGQAEDYNVYILQGYPCSGMPNVGNVSGISFTCPNTAFVLTTSNYSKDYGTSFNWEKFDETTQMWVSIGNTPTCIVQGIDMRTDFRLVMVCANAGGAGISNTITVHTTLDSIIYSTPVCTGDSLKVSIGICSTCTATITGPNNLLETQSFSIPNASLANDGWYAYTVNGNGCAAIVDSFYMDVSNCQDSVWPGDVNNDLITNNLDALYLAVYNGASGYARPNASINYIGQACADWPSTGINNVNLKHADCNGDGNANVWDTAAIMQNYNLPHLKNSYIPQAKVTAFPDLYFDTTGVDFLPGASGISIPVKLGTASVPMERLYGLAAELKLSGFTSLPPLNITNTSSWLGYKFSFNKIVGNNQHDLAYARNNHLTASGYGILFYVNLVIPPSAAGDTATLYFDNVTMVDSLGNVLSDYNALPLTFIVENPTGIKEQKPVQSASVIPNPSGNAASLMIHVQAPAVLKIGVTDITGKQLWQTKYNAATHQSIALPPHLSSGIYFITIRNNNQFSRTLKWIKQD